MEKKYFMNFTDANTIVTTSDDEEKINLFFEQGWEEIDLEHFKEKENIQIRTDFFLKDLVKMSLEERISALQEIEEDFELVGPSYCYDWFIGFDNNSDMEVLFEYYGVTCHSFYYLKRDEQYALPDLKGKAIGKYILEQLNEIYIVPMVVICTGEQYVEGFDFKNIKAVNKEKLWI